MVLRDPSPWVSLLFLEQSAQGFFVRCDFMEALVPGSRKDWSGCCADCLAVPHECLDLGALYGAQISGIVIIMKF